MSVTGVLSDPSIVCVGLSLLGVIWSLAHGLMAVVVVVVVSGVVVVVLLIG